MKLLALAGLLAAAALLLVGAGCGSDEPSTDEGAATAPFDRAFIDAMVPHHESAIEMARSAEAAGLSNPELRQVADDILSTQQVEIDQLKQWRGEWFGSEKIDPDGAAALGMTDTQMGMANGADALLNSGDVDADFAQMMIAHHEGAIEMAKLALDRAERAELRDMAKAIIAAQEREIEIMRPHAGGGMDHG